MGGSAEWTVFCGAGSTRARAFPLRLKTSGGAYAVDMLQTR